MKHLLCALFVFVSALSFSQTSKIKPNKYPSLLWEIKGKGLKKPSYLFGTMHVSSKMAFNLSDSFYLGIRNAQVVALETNPGTWQEDFSRYDLEGEGLYSRRGFGNLLKGYSGPQDYLSINTIKLTSYEKMMEAALYSNPSIINNFLYRSNSEASSDFEEDTYLDLHIFQAGTKLGKKICGVEDFDGSMRLVKEAYMDAAKEKNKKERSYDIDEDLSYRNLEEAYRTGNLDLLDTINKVNSQSAAFDEK
ncbi:MAG TPA: TraB/GumN family protein, partial [Flavisolibacter sp.]